MEEGVFVGHWLDVRLHWVETSGEEDTSKKVVKQ